MIDISFCPTLKISYQHNKYVPASASDSGESAMTHGLYILLSLIFDRRQRYQSFMSSEFFQPKRG